MNLECKKCSDNEVRHVQLRNMRETALFEDRHQTS